MPLYGLTASFHREAQNKLENLPVLFNTFLMRDMMNIKSKTI